MFYVLFTYSKGQKEKDFLRFRSEDDVIKFIHNHYEKIDIVQIIEAEKSFKLGLVETAELIKSSLIREEESLTPVADSILKGENTFLGPESGKNLTEEEILKKNEELFKRADGAIEMAKKDLGRSPLWGKVKPPQKEKKQPKKKKELDKADWPKCPECNRRKIAPWNKSGRCSHCQQYKKRPKRK